MKRLLLLMLTFLPLMAVAENWDYVCSSGQYYYGIGHGATEEEAKNAALAELSSMIAVHVSSDFTELTNEKNANGKIDHQSQVLNCVKTYSQVTLNNIVGWPEKKGNEWVYKCYMKRSELENIYKGRIAKAKDMVNRAAEALQAGKIDMALQYYYWGYSLIRSLQRPNEVTDGEGRLLVNWLPLRIDEILSDITVTFDKAENNEVDLLFYYKGKPVSSVDFTYNDGRSSSCDGAAKDGRGLLDMTPDYETSTYHLSIEYQFKNHARGDDEMRSVLNVITPKVFPKAVHVVKAKTTATAAKTRTKTPGAANAVGIHLNPKASQLATDAARQADVVAKVVDAIQRRSYSDANRYFTIDNVARRRTATTGDHDRSISMGGQEKITTNRYTKDEYLKNLDRCFRRNEFINIKFTNNDIQWLEKYKDRPDTRELFAIQIGQEYSSSTYADKGYLFLLVNLTDHDQPQIKVRTWQPNEVDMSKIYNAGDFYSE